MVFFGTGKYLELSDDTPVGATTQTVYGLWDERTGPDATPPNTSQGPIAGRSQLLRQTIVQTLSVSGKNVRVTSDSKMDWDTHRGWYLDLPIQGEKQVSDPVLREGRLIFTTLIPDPDVCSFGGTSWLMEIDVGNGGRVDRPPFDLNDDKQFTKADMVPDPSGALDEAGNPLYVNVGGVESSEGILPTPTILSASQTMDYKYSSGSSGGILFTRESTGGRGRLGWQQLL
jgi:type IV pilus assembly protein PilY1